MSQSEQPSSQSPAPQAETTATPTKGGEDVRNMAMIVWIAHLAGLVTGGLGNIVAVIIAYIKRSDAAGTDYASHFSQAISAFWIYLLLGLGAFALTAVSVGILAITFLIPAIYILIKGIKGLIRVNDRRAYA